MNKLKKVEILASTLALAALASAFALTMHFVRTLPRAGRIRRPDA
jgi:hypothetical protein